MANIQYASTGNKIRLKKRVLTRPWPTLVPPLQATKALVWGQYNIVSQGVMGTRHKIRLKKRVLIGPWPTSSVPALETKSGSRKRFLIGRRVYKKIVRLCNFFLL